MFEISLNGTISYIKNALFGVNYTEDLFTEMTGIKIYQADVIYRLLDVKLGILKNITLILELLLKL